jgi:putative flavoprotein involved in K+ transport
VPDRPRLAIDLVADGFETVLWATGYRADYSWLHVPVLDRKGELRHDGGVVRDAPGLYRIGLNFLRRRKSTFIHGAEDDVTDLVEHLVAHVGAPAARN